MIRQEFHVRKYWKVVVWYDLDYHFFNAVLKEMREMDISEDTIDTVYKMMKSKKAKAVTISNIYKYSSLVLFNIHSSFQDYLNSLVHEAEHVKQSMLKAYNVKDEGEAPAYTLGYLVIRMWEGFKKII